MSNIRLKVSLSLQIKTKLCAHVSTYLQELPFYFEKQNTVNSLYCGHPRDLKCP